MEIACGSTECWYKSDRTRAMSSYCKELTVRVVYNDVGSPSELGIDDYDGQVSEEDEVALCDECFSNTDTTQCSICERHMVDGWVHKKHMDAARNALGHDACKEVLGHEAGISAVCRRCLDYDLMPGVFDGDDDSAWAPLPPGPGVEEGELDCIVLPACDRDVVECAYEWAGKWLEPFSNAGHRFYCRRCPTRDAAAVDAKVRRTLAETLCMGIRDARARFMHKRAQCKSEAQARVAYMTSTMCSYVPGLSPREARKIVERLRHPWTGHGEVRDAASLLRWVADLGE